jgi:hypothetical protein
VRRSKSVLQLLLFGGDEGGSEEERIRNKNIRQTELLVDLREAVLQVARHFTALDPRLARLQLQADYSMESHAHDHERYVDVSLTRKRRAKALLGE